MDPSSTRLVFYSWKIWNLRETHWDWRISFFRFLSSPACHSFRHYFPSPLLFLWAFGMRVPSEPIEFRSPKLSLRYSINNLLRPECRRQFLEIWSESSRSSCHVLFPCSPTNLWFFASCSIQFPKDSYQVPGILLRNCRGRFLRESKNCCQNIVRIPCRYLWFLQSVI